MIFSNKERDVKIEKLLHFYQNRFANREYILDLTNCTILEEMGCTISDIFELTKSTPYKLMKAPHEDSNKYILCRVY